MPRWTTGPTYVRRRLKAGDRFTTAEDPGPEDRGVVVASNRHHYTEAPALLRFDDGTEAEATRYGLLVGSLKGLKARPVAV